jgi:hypothetical protein
VEKFLFFKCGGCECPAGKRGANCELLLNCDGTYRGPTETPKEIDQCGVCGGNSTSCIGCDGTLYGPSVIFFIFTTLIFFSTTLAEFAVEMELLVSILVLAIVAKFASFPSLADGARKLKLVNSLQPLLAIKT